MNIVRQLSAKLNAHYVANLKSGHMGARVMGFMPTNSGPSIIVKFAPAGNASATRDLAANGHAYRKLADIGAREILPLARKVPVTGGRALAMEDVGRTMTVQNGGYRMFELLVRHLFPVIERTTRKARGKSAENGEREVLRHIEHFLPKEDRGFCREIQGSGSARLRASALMLLDFTPDNVAVNCERMFFIDPWRQNTYLGNPAVSIGQFATLAELYRLRAAEAGAELLSDMAERTLPKLLGTDRDSVRFGWSLGVTLQYVLSAYVRRKSDPVLSRELLYAAYDLWA